MNEGPSAPEPGAVALLDAAVGTPERTSPYWVFPEVGEPLFEALRRSGYSRVALQVPAGLTRNAHDLAARLRRETGVDVHLVNRACFGACDLPTAEESRKADAAVVLGHSPIPNVARPLPTFFVEMRHPGGDPEQLAATLDASAIPRRLGLVCSVQHLDLLPRLEAALERRGFRSERSEGDHRLAYGPQALGCNYTSAQAVSDRVDAFLFLGTGRFHPVGLAFAVDRPVYSLDPLQGQLEGPVDREGLLKARWLMVARCRDAKRWGILVSGFVGQDRSATALALRERALRSGREAEILVFGRLDPRDLEGRDLDAYVNTACPRIALDDAASYPKPIVTPPEFLMALGELPLAPYRFDTYH